MIPPQLAEVLIDGGTIELAEIGIRTSNVLFFTGMPNIITSVGSVIQYRDIGIQNLYQGVWFGTPSDESEINSTELLNCGVGIDLRNIKSTYIIDCEFQNNLIVIQGSNVSPFIDGDVVLTKKVMIR